MKIQKMQCRQIYRHCTQSGRFADDAQNPTGFN